MILRTSLSTRTHNLAASLICLFALLTAFILQYADHLSPCPLCIFQRAFYLLAGVVFLLATFHSRPSILKTDAILSGLFSLGGALIAGRQIWIQHLPSDQVPACLPNLGSLFHYLPALKVISMVLKGSGDCAIVNWRLWGMSMPEWSLLCFLALFLISLKILFSTKDS
ncbi:MAG: disulfide bond formation protein B [Proteobacteria bacterium]|nr:disulfide bond formation protein B [Pseudomonadota bacterium]MDE3207253.1 disulfide bond formation protein B [Pseudomonadota bacterium]